MTPTESSRSWRARLRAGMDALRARVGWPARVSIMAVATALTIGTWGPWMALPLGLSPSRWEHFVYQTSVPYCHQLPERSYHLMNHVFPVCTRCTGMWLGITLGVLLAMLVVPRNRWWIGSGLAIVATAASAFDKLREESSRVDAPDVRAILGALIFLGVTLAVSYDTLAVLLGIGRAIGRLPSLLVSTVHRRRPRSTSTPPPGSRTESP